ncbi:MAG: PAS domain S-box protein, partial [Deltaproteobacteria bacterium]|nr:PAS domain S-box protein [Deltaproteobacteria bacterium]
VVGTFDFSLKPVTDEHGKVVLIIPEGRNITDRKRMEQELRESEERYRELVELSPDAIFLNHEGRFFFANSAALELFGATSPDQLIGKPVRDVIHPDYREVVAERIRQMMERGTKSPLIEQKNIRLDGTEFDVEVTAAPLIYQGKPMVQVVARDVTERKRADQALRDSEARLQAIIDNSTAVIFLKDIQGRYMLVNREYEKLFHVSGEQIKGKTDHDIFPRETAEAFRANDLKVLELGTPVEFEEVAPHDGAIHTYIAAKFPLFSSAGLPYAVCGIATDITQRKRAEERYINERQQAETWLQSLIDTTQDAVISIDRQGGIVLFNPSAEKMFGYTRAEVEGRNVNLLMAEPYASQHDSYISSYEQTGLARAIGRIRTVVARRKNGDAFPVEISVTEVTAAGEARYAAFIRDISEKTKLQEQLIESERLAAIATTAAKLAHEIGNPLNGMYMTAQLLERRLARHADSLDDTVEPTLRTLMDEITRLNQLLLEFRSLSRREHYNFRPTAVAAVAAEVLEMETARYQGLKIHVEQDFPAELPLVHADSEKLKQALLNLCKNAVEAMPQGGTLTLRGRNSGRHVILEVADTGLGIPAEVDIFEPFATTKSWGTGLGLVIVRQILTAHGGAVAYSSERGRGTVFRLTLPVSPPARN